MDQTFTLGVVGGGGWLGGAIVGAILEAGLLAPESLTLSCRREAPGRFPGARWTSDNQELADRSDVIILSVRPDDWASLRFSASGKLVISVMAGVRLAAIGERHDTRRVVRALPNAAAAVRKSYTPWFASTETSERDRAIVRAIFGACGVEDEVSSERHIDYMTGLTGSGPAFPALLAAAMMKDAVAQGLPPEVARRAVNTVLSGAGRLLEMNDASPEATVEAFVAYRGTTAAAIEAMRAGGFDTAVADGLAAALEKSLRIAEDH